MFIVTDKQLKLMEKAGIQDITEDTCQLVVDEFPELVMESRETLHKKIADRIKTATTTYRLTTFDAIQDYIILTLQYPVLTMTTLPADLKDLLTWPGMKEADKIAETEKLLLRKY